MLPPCMYDHRPSDHDNNSLGVGAISVKSGIYSSHLSQVAVIAEVDMQIRSIPAVALGE